MGYHQFLKSHAFRKKFLIAQDVHNNFLFFLFYSQSPILVEVISKFDVYVETHKWV